MQTKFAIFSYYIASYSEWLQNSALESRGIMFELDENDNPVRIACRPMQKFFNYQENPFTETVFDNDIQYIFKKEDGSLISTYLDKDELFVKSKASLFSQQALDAQKWLYDEKRRPLLHALTEYAKMGYTVNMEWVSPSNKIVVNYPEDFLVILNIRHNITGEYIKRENLLRDSQIKQYLVDEHEFDSLEDLINNTVELKDEEGYVVWSNDRPFFKLKCPWYLHLHSVKSSVSSDKNLWEAVADGVSDDIKSLFVTDEQSLNRISDFEKIYKKSFSEVFNIVTNTYYKLVGLSRKDYAIQAQSILNADNPKLFSIVMKLYLNGPTDETTDLIKDHLIKFRDDYLNKE